jgi:hypothetical protein
MFLILPVALPTFSTETFVVKWVFGWVPHTRCWFYHYLAIRPYANCLILRETLTVRVKDLVSKARLANLLLLSCETLFKSLSFSVSYFPYLSNGENSDTILKKGYED